MLESMYFKVKCYQNIFTSTWKSVRLFICTYLKALYLSLVKTGSVVSDKLDFEMSSIHFLYFKIVRDPIFNCTNLNSLTQKGFLSLTCFIKINPVALQKYFNVASIVSCSFSPLTTFGKVRGLYLNKYKSLLPKRLCAKFQWNKPSGSDENFHLSSIYFGYFGYTSLWKSVWPFHPKIFCVSLVEIGKADLETNFFQMSSVQFCYFANNSLEKRASSFEKT